MKHTSTSVLLTGLCVILNGCTYSITMAHTEGQATDLIDEVQRTDADVKADLSIPAI